MLAITSNCCLNFAIDNDVDFDSCLRTPLEYLIQSPFLVVEGRSTQEKFGRQPPVLDVDDFFGALQRDRNGVEIILPVDVPFDIVALALRSKGLETMRRRDLGALLVCDLLVLFVVPVIRIYEVLKLAYFVLKVACLYLDIIEVGILDMLVHVCLRVVLVRLRFSGVAYL